jgi:hypothetical protein
LTSVLVFFLTGVLAGYILMDRRLILSNKIKMAKAKPSQAKPSQVTYPGGQEASFE